MRIDARRESFAPGEMAVVLSRYDVGVIKSVREMPRGSTDKPKVVLKTERGLLLLKRRPASREQNDRVAFVHGVQSHLASRGFSLPRLVATTNERAPSVRIHDRVYELYEFVRGAMYAGTGDESQAAGRSLAELHRSVAGFKSDHGPTGGGFHATPQLGQRIEQLPSRAPSLEPSKDALRSLRDIYEEASRNAADVGVGAWPRQVVHGDWHPGNLLFSDGDVTAVLDFDSARVDVRAMDLASGALQFSLARSGTDVTQWPAEVDRDRFKRFCSGYDGFKGCRLSTGEIDALPWLMIESLIVEAIAPIAATGSFASMEGGAFLRMVDRKVRWIREHGDDLRSLAHGEANA
jgi:homoserine kinase type II